MLEDNMHEDMELTQGINRRKSVSGDGGFGLRMDTGGGAGGGNAPRTMSKSDSNVSFERGDGAAAEADGSQGQGQGQGRASTAPADGRGGAGSRVTDEHGAAFETRNREAMLGRDFNKRLAKFLLSFRRELLKKANAKVSASVECLGLLCGERLGR